MSDLPVPAVKPPEPPQPQTLVCANCHADLAGEFCARCGQRHEPHIHTVAHFAGEAFESISHADSRLWRTLWYLFSRPGFLTREFFAGRRATYLPPFRLYLVLSVVFFSVVGIGDGDGAVDLDEPVSAEDAAAIEDVAAMIESKRFGHVSDAQGAATASQLRAIARQAAAAAPRAPAGDASAAEPAAATPDDTSTAAARATPTDAADAAAAAQSAAPDAAEKGANVMTGEGVQKGIAQFCEDFRAGTTGEQEPTAQQRSVRRWCARFADQGMGAIGEALLDNIPKAMFVFLPLLALCMKLIYWRPKRYYVEHLLFLVHNHTLVFLVLASVMLVGLIPWVGDYVWLLNWATFFYLIWYIYRAMRNVYGQGRALTLLKYLLLGNAYFVAAFGVFLLTVIFSAITA